MTTSKGLFNKYEIKKADGSPIAPDAQYFVLRLDTDPHAREAILAYADSLDKTDENSEMVGDIRNWVSVLTRRWG